MGTIASLAREWNTQPYVVAAFANLGTDYTDNGELNADTEATIREAWAIKLGEWEGNRNCDRPGYGDCEHGVTESDCGHVDCNVIDDKDHHWVGPYVVCYAEGDCAAHTGMTSVFPSN